MNQDKIKEFIDNLSRLSKKYGLSISSCGCCPDTVWDVNKKNWGSVSWETGQDVIYRTYKETYQ